MQPEVKILKSAFAIFGLHPVAETESRAQKLYSHFLDATILVLATGIGAQTVRDYCGTGSAILPMTYFLCTLFAIAKRRSIIRRKGHLRRLLRNFQHPHSYPDERRFRLARYPPARIRKIHAVVALPLASLFFFAYASPFLSVTLGNSLDYSLVIYPFYIPWPITNFRAYMLNYLVQAALVAPALIGIYAFAVLSVFVAVNFQIEFDKIGEAVATLETRVLDGVIRNGGTSREAGTRRYFAGRRYSREYEMHFNSNLRDCILHFRLIRE